jgi:hypothetical protein
MLPEIKGTPRMDSGRCGWWTANTGSFAALRMTTSRVHLWIASLEFGEDEADAADDVIGGSFVGGERKELDGKVA